jgi:RNA polymerase sigma-70 factor, ECF subfamily
VNHATPGQSPEEEAELLRRACAGEKDAYGQIVEIHRERLYGAAFRALRNHEDARDLSQDAFVNAFRNIHRFDSSRPFYPWLSRILRNLCIDHLRRNRPGRQLSYDQMLEEQHVPEESFGDALGAAPFQGDVRDRIQAQQQAALLRTAIGTLKPEFREIIMMFHFEEMKYHEIAETLDIPIGTVMSRLFHARRALKNVLAEGVGA